MQAKPTHNQDERRFLLLAASRIDDTRVELAGRDELLTELEVREACAFPHRYSRKTEAWLATACQGESYQLNPVMLLVRAV